MDSLSHSSRWRRFSNVLSILALAVVAPDAWSSPDRSLVDDGTWKTFRHPFTNHTAVYDSANNRMVVFGGSSADFFLTNDVWELSLTGTPSWTKLDPTGPRPVISSTYTAIYDPPRSRMILFGNDQHEVWELTLSGAPVWTKLIPTGATPDIRGYTIYDPVRDRMLVVGMGSSSSEMEVHSLSLSGAPAWTQLDPSGPLPDWSETAIYDPVLDRIIFLLWGSNDVWALSLAGSLTWAQLAPSGAPPSDRFDHTAIYDPAGDRMIVFGGGKFPLAFNDTWQLALASPAWTELTPSGTPPSPRARHTAVYDSQAGRMIVFGGTKGTGIGEESYAFELDLTGPLAWAKLGPGSDFPKARGFHAAAYDPPGQRMIVFGGRHLDVHSNHELLNDTWTLSLTEEPLWTQILPAGTPPSPRYGQSLILDSVRRRILVFGGYDGANRNDLWELTLTGAPTWTQLNPMGGPPSGRAFHWAIHDPSRDRMLVFGGSTNDLWELSLSGTPTWTQLAPAGTAPSSRSSSGVTYDPGSDRIIMYGGVNSSGGYIADLWELALAGDLTWTQLSPNNFPGGRTTTAVHDPQRSRMVIFGGHATTPHALPIVLNDAWSLQLSGSPQWTHLQPEGSIPAHRGSNVLVLDRLNDRMVVFGGEGSSPSPQINRQTMSGTHFLEWGNPIVGVLPPAGEPDPTVVGRFGLRHAGPNPVRRDARVELAVPEGGMVSVNVYDIRGRLVAPLVRREFVPGRHPIQWDGTDAAGRRVRAGVYLIQAIMRGAKSSVRVALVP